MTGQVGPGGAQVEEHGPEGEDGGGVEAHVAKGGEERAFYRREHEQDDDGGHLEGGFDLAEAGYGYRGALAQFRHPFAQGGYNDFAADDDGGSHCKPGGGMFLNQQDQGHDDHQLVRHRVQEGAEGGGLVVFAGDVAVQPIGDG